MSQSIPPRQSPPEDPPSPPSGDAPKGQKDQYTLDEMLKALRDQEREKEEKGEIVTRSDGTVAVKVKRRKRRSDQPEKTSPEKVKKRMIVKILIAASICLFAILGFIGWVLTFSSKAYREKAEAQAGEWTGSEVELNGLKLMPTSVRMSEANFKWPNTSYFQSLQLKNLDGHAGLLSFFGSPMGGLEVGGAVGELKIAVPTKAGEVGTHYEVENFPFNFGRYFCNALDVKFGSNDFLALKGASVSLRHLGEKGWRASIDQGLFNLKGWGNFPVANAMIHFRDEEVELTSLTLEKPSDSRSTIIGSIKASGGIPLEVGKKSHLDLECSSFPAEKLFGEQMGKVFDGMIRSATGQVQFTMGEQGFDELELTFNGDFLELIDFPFLRDLNELFSGESFDKLLFDTDVRGDLRARPEGIAIENLEMAQKNIFIVKGDMIVASSGELGGRITLWINHGLIKSEPSLANYPGLNKSDRPGYSKIEFELGGTVDAPTDTFRTVTGMQTPLQGFDEVAPPPSKKLWELLTPSATDE